MPLREIVAKATAFGLTAAALFAGGILVLLGPHAYNDYLNTALGVLLILLGLATGGMGTVVIVGVIAVSRARAREESLHVTPRSGPPAPPPAWGMGDIGRPGAVTGAPGEAGHGGGAVRVMSAVTRSWDAPLIVAALLAWTIVALLVAAPR